MLTWEESGDRTLRMTLQDVQQLAVSSGFIFENTTEDLPLSRRANLPALFEAYSVNSCSAFIRLFTASPLLPPWELAAGGKKKVVRKPAPQAAALEEAAAWVVQETGSTCYFGQMRNGQRHGSGLLVTQGTPSMVYIGAFQDGKRQGLGEVLTSRGEAYQGSFEDDLMWGPGCYTFPKIAAGAGAEGASAPRALAKYEGMFNGRPLGKGCLFWEDGEEEAGEFDGRECVRRLSPEECEGVLLVAHSNAEEARRQSERIKAELVAQQLWGRAAALAAAVSSSFLQ